MSLNSFRFLFQLFSHHYGLPLSAAAILAGIPAVTVKNQDPPDIGSPGLQLSRRDGVRKHISCKF